MDVGLCGDTKARGGPFQTQLFLGASKCPHLAQRSVLGSCSPGEGRGWGQNFLWEVPRPR